MDSWILNGVATPGWTIVENITKISNDPENPSGYTMLTDTNGGDLVESLTITNNTGASFP